MKDYLDFLHTIRSNELIYYDNQEWSDEYYGCPRYKEYKETWC